MFGRYPLRYASTQRVPEDMRRFPSDRLISSAVSAAISERV